MEVLYHIRPYKVINGYVGYYTHYLIEYMGYWVYSNHIWDIQWYTTIFGIYNIFGIYWVYTTIFMGYFMKILEYTILEISLIVINDHIWDTIPIILLNIWDIGYYLGYYGIYHTWNIFNVHIWDIQNIWDILGN